MSSISPISSSQDPNNVNSIAAPILSISNSSGQLRIDPQDLKCTICLETMKKVAMLIPCKHFFCEPCIIQHHQHITRPTCPLCRAHSWPLPPNETIENGIQCASAREIMQDACDQYYKDNPATEDVIEQKDSSSPQTENGASNTPDLELPPELMQAITERFITHLQNSQLYVEDADLLPSHLRLELSTPFLELTNERPRFTIRVIQNPYRSALFTGIAALGIISAFAVGYFFESITP